jgi:delta24-sterol reductase
MVLANGSIVTASLNENPDLFHGAAGALGALGITTAIELRLIQTKRYVRMTYYRLSTVHEASERIKCEIRDPKIDYVDGILFSESPGVVITGHLTDETPPCSDVVSFSRPWDPWFYLHAHNATSSASAPQTVYTSIMDYLCRYDRGGFWVGREAFKYWGGLVPFNRWARWF